MTTFHIRVANLSEQTYLEDLQRRASLTNPGDRDALLAHPDAVQLPPEHIAAGTVFVLEQDQAIAGFAALLPHDQQSAELDALFVEPTMQRRGAGRALVEHCCNTARLRGCASLNVVANPHAQDFYVACGFTITGTTSTRFGPALLMRKTL